MGDFIGLETSIKNCQRFKDEPEHWAYFSFGHKYPLQKEARKSRPPVATLATRGLRHKTMCSRSIIQFCELHHIRNRIAWSPQNVTE